MFFLTFSKEILFLSLAVCAITLTVFMVWFMYYLIQAVREVKQASSLLLDQVRVVEKWIKQIRRNLSVGFAVAGVVKEAAGSAKEFFDHWRSKLKKDDDNDDIFTKVK